jgi:energy-coupling factor transporter ATP-binding protein EcfA2
MQTNNKLFIGGIHIEGNGVRIFKPQKIDNFLKEGLVAVNGKSGAGKTSLLEVIKLAVQGKDALRDMNIMTDGAEEVDIRVPIADFKNPDSRFFIRAVAKATGEIRYTFQVESNGKFRNTETPLQGMDKLTVSKLQNMMNTSLTYGIENFLSEDYLQVKKFIYETFGDELTKLGLIVAKDSPDYAESINGKIDTAISERDEVTRRQSKLGAYMVNLEGKTRPKRIEISQMEEREKELNQELANLRAEHKVKIDSKEQRIKNVMAEAENVKTKADIVKRDLTDFNNELNRQEFLTVAN